MKKFLTTLAGLTVFATPAFAQSFCTCDGTGNVLTFTHNAITRPNQKHCSGSEWAKLFRHGSRTRLGPQFE